MHVLLYQVLCMMGYKNEFYRQSFIINAPQNTVPHDCVLCVCQCTRGLQLLKLKKFPMKIEISPHDVRRSTSI